MYKLISSIALTGALCACGSDNSSSSDFASKIINKDVLGEKVTFALGIDQGLETHYVITLDDVMDTTSTISSLGQGLEISGGYAYVYTVANTTFSVVGNSAKAFSEKDGEVQEINEAIVESSLWGTFGNANNEKMLAIDANWSGLHDHKLYTFDAATGKSEGSVSLQILTEGSGVSAWPTSLVVSEDKLYISYIKFDTAYTTPDADTGYVAVFDYPVTEDATPINTITTDSVSNLGTHGSTTGLIKVDNGDLYGYTNGEVSGGFYPASTKPSSIVRIKDGAMVFDDTYEFNIETATNGGKIFWFDYLGDNKAIARIVVRRDMLVDYDENPETPDVQIDDELDAVPWEDYYNYSKAYRQKLVIIDLENKTITDIDGIPNHWARLANKTEIMAGKYYVTITTSEGSSVYQIDLETASAVKGASIEGYTIRGFQDLYN